ncbi:MAG: DUF4215 domain-containing protein [Myxococcales bacterium]|nr:DUF4215 domain-containing protein [Myxococcales bacterium]
MRRSIVSIAAILALAGAGCAGDTNFDCTATGTCDKGVPTIDGGGPNPDGPPVPASCGNKTVEKPQEECDDGNKDDTDECLSNCKLAFCGDGKIFQGVEECDPGQTPNDSCQSCKSVDFQANVITTGDQGKPDVTVAADGTIILVWEDKSALDGDTSGSTIRMRRFDATGKALDQTEVVVPTTTNADQVAPRVAVSTQGVAFVVWTDWSKTAPDTSATAVRGRFYDNTGSAKGNDVIVNTTTNATQAAPDVTATPDGGFVVAFNDISIGGSSNGVDIRVRRFSPALQPVGNDYRANTTNQGDQQLPSVAAAANGNVFVVWQTWSGSDGESSGIGIGGRLFDAAGKTIGGEKILNSVGTGNQENPRVAATSSGFVVVWDDASKQGGDNTKQIRWRAFDANASAQGQDVTANTTTAGDQAHPDVVGSGDMVAVVWEDPSQQSSSGLDVRGRRYKAGNALDAQDLALNTYVPVDQSRPAVAFTPDGTMVIAWESTSGKDQDGSGIRLRIVAPR